MAYIKKGTLFGIYLAKLIFWERKGGSSEKGKLKSILFAIGLKTHIGFKLCQSFAKLKL